MFSFQESFKYPDEERRKPAVPRPQDQPIMGLKTTKNFITQNAVENIMSVPKKPQKNFVDTRSGDKQPLEPSGMEPKFLKKKVSVFSDMNDSVRYRSWYWTAIPILLD